MLELYFHSPIRLLGKLSKTSPLFYFVNTYGEIGGIGLPSLTAAIDGGES
jgi:hypothetical protein